MFNALPSIQDSILQNIPHWQVHDPRFNEEPAWPASDFPEAHLHYMKEAGCLVTSLATLLRLYGVEEECDEALFNPWILSKKLKDIHAFDSSADLELECLRELYPIEFVEQRPFDAHVLAQFLECGVPCIVSVPGMHDAFHFVVPTGCQNGDFSILDSGWDKSYLSEFDRAFEIYRFALIG